MARWRGAGAWWPIGAILLVLACSEAGTHREHAEMGALFEPVCRGEGVAEAGTYPGVGDGHPVVLVDVDDPDVDHRVPPEWKADELADVQLVACYELESHRTGECRYTGGMVLEAHSYTLTAVVHSALTGERIDAATFESYPNPCPPSVSGVPPAIDQLPHDEMMAWLEPIVTGAGSVTVPEWPAPPDSLRVGRSLGDTRAPVRVVIYLDPRCRPCAVMAEQVLPSLIAGPIAEGTVFLTYSDLIFLQESFDAAVAIRVAEELDHKSWDYVRILYHDQSRDSAGPLSLERLADFAEAVGLDREAFLSEMQDPRYLEAVEEETARARALGRTMVPSIVVNGVVLEGLQTWDDVLAAISAARAVVVEAAPASIVLPDATAAPSH